MNIDPCYISYDWFGIEGSYGQAIDITVNVLCDEIPTPSGDVTQEFTPGQTLADLDVTGQGLTWFTDEDLENLIEPSLPLEHGATYYVVSTDSICQSVALAITVTDMCFEFETPTGDVTQEFIPSQTLADLDISGEGLVWFADSDLEEELEDSTLLEHGMTYYVVSTNDNCQSEPLAITVTDICFDFETPIGEVSQEFNSGETLNDRCQNGCHIRPEQIGSHTCYVTHVVTHIICNGCRVTRVIFRNSCFNFTHQICSNVCCLSVDSSTYTSK